VVRAADRGQAPVVTRRDAARFGLAVCADAEAASCPYRGRHGAQASLQPPAGGHLPRHEPRRRPRRDLPRRRRPPPLRRPAPPGRAGIRMDAARFLPHAEPLPLRHHHRARAPFARHAPALLPLRPGVQPPLRPRRPPLPGPLPRRVRGERRAPRGCLRLRARQPRPRVALRLARRLAVARRRGARRPTPEPEPAPAPAPTSRRARRRLRGRSAAGSREHARPASACGSASSPRR